MLIQILGAAAQLVAFSFPDWETASFIGVPNLIFEITGSGGAARFVMVLFCFSVIANTAPTIYSCGLSAQVAIPWLVRGESGSSFTPHHVGLVPSCCVLRAACGVRRAAC
jgi:purine-cytosine permease-like protein